MAKKIYPNWTIEEFVKSGRRLEHVSTGLWSCAATAIGEDNPWFCPAMFEQMCVMDDDLERLFKTYNGTDRQKERIQKHIKEVILRKYLQLVATKCYKLIPQMIDYFEVLYNTGEWKSDKEKFKTESYAGIEPSSVRTDKFIV